MDPAVKLLLGRDKNIQEGNLKDKIYLEIFKSIVSGEITPDTIVREKILVEKYGVSRAPVREALIQLCSEDVMVSMPRFGYKVKPLSKSDIENVLEFRSALEGGLLARFGINITEAQISELEKIDELCISHESKNDFWTHWGYNADFHMTLMSFSQNDFSYKMLERSMKTLTRAYAQFYWDKWHNIVFPTDTKYHKNIINCLKQKNIEKTIEYLIKDLGDFGR